MHYTIIDMEKDPRCGQFAYFRAMQYPFASVTVEVDITDMMTARGSRPFFLSLLYAVVRAANAVPQLRRRLLPDGRVAEYDWCAVLHRDEAGRRVRLRHGGGQSCL